MRPRADEHCVAARECRADKGGHPRPAVLVFHTDINPRALCPGVDVRVEALSVPGTPVRLVTYWDAIVSVSLRRLVE